MRAKQPLKKLSITSALSGALLLSCAPVFSQSLDVHNPSKLNEGLNKSVIDSFGGDQYWYFWAKPGNFTFTFGRSDSEEGFNVGAKPACGAILNPAVPGSKMSFKETPSGVVFTGHCDRSTRVLIEVDPAKSPLVRQTTQYRLVVNGSTEGGGGEAVQASAAGVDNLSAMAGSSGGAASSGGGSSDVVTGVYDVNDQNFGAAKLSADGSIVTTTGQTGKWMLFDAGTRTYVIKIGSATWTLVFEPARGFVDNNGQLKMTMKKQVR